MKKLNRAERRRNARRFALQAIYEWEISQNAPDEVLLHVYEENDFSETDLEHFNRIFRGVVNQVDAIDDALQVHCDRPLTELNPIELAILRLAGFELLYCKDIPPKAVVNEAIEITKEYGSQQGFKYVNAVLDSLKGAV